MYTLTTRHHKGFFLVFINLEGKQRDSHSLEQILQSLESQASGKIHSLITGQETKKPTIEAHTNFLSPVILDSSLDKECRVIRVPSIGT